MEIEFKASTDPGVIVAEAAARGLALAAEYVLEAANRTVPVEEHTLERSGTASVNDEGTLAAVSYDTPYAVPVHEVLTARHDDGRRAKWLELTMQEEADAVREVIAQTLRGAL